MPQKIRNHFVIAIQRTVQRIQIRFDLQAFPYGWEIKSIFRQHERFVGMITQESYAAEAEPIGQ